MGKSTPTSSSSSSSSSHGIWDALNPRRLVRLQKWGLLALRLLALLGVAAFHCGARGIRSLLRLSFAAYFLAIWCSALCLAALSGVPCFMATMLPVGAVLFFLGFIPALILLVLFSAVVLWLYGSFWTTLGVLLVAGALFLGRCTKAAICLVLLYSAYSVHWHWGWFTFCLATLFAFLATDLLLHFVGWLQEKRGKEPSKDQRVEVEVEELSADQEVRRVLDCSDHYAVLGFPRLGACEEVSVKREYKKKAMLVHPDKHKGNPQAEEAFKRLLNAYEVLLDAEKKKSYDEELRREEFLASFRSTAANEDDTTTTLAGRPIVCRTCRQLHLWIPTDRQKQHARWCQDCQDYHSAKDGDGWLEQSYTSIFFGWFQMVNSPQAYACAGGVVYDVTDWALCQGLNCPANTHKPSFSVGASRNNHSMSEEEFYEWLQRAMGGSSNHRAHGGGGGGGGRKKRRGNRRH